MKKSSMSVWSIAMLVLSACGGEAEDATAALDESAELDTASEELGTVSEALLANNSAGAKPGSCLDRCLSLCPKDSIGGIDVACGLTCLGACSAPRQTLAVSNAASLTQ